MSRLSRLLRFGWTVPRFVAKTLADTALSQDWMLPARVVGRAVGIDGLADGLVPRSWTALPLVMAEGWALMLERLPGQELAWQEVRNKVQAFSCFRYADSWWDGDPGRSVARLAALEAWPRLWTLEGLGWVLAERAWKDLPPEGLLTTAEVPEEALICLHPGMGLYLAGRQLAASEPLPDLLRRLVALCRNNSRPGWESVAFEALGLLVRARSSSLVERVDRELHRIDADLVPWFWHGVGRGLYFVLPHTLPYLDSVGRALERAREAPHEVGRLNAVSGLAWAMTLVNLRHPALLETAIRDRSLEAGEDKAWSCGVGSALLLWSRAVGRDSLLDRFLHHSGSDLWQRLVRRPCEAALGHRRPEPEIFRYQP